MKASVTFAFSGLFLAVAVCYYFFGMPLSKPEAPLVTIDDSKLLPFSSTAKVRLIQIQKLSEKETITLEHTGQEWYLRHPVNYLADKQMADGLLTALRVSTKARRLNREKGWEEYGLVRPEIKIGVEAEGDFHRRYLYLGDKSPVSEMIFARWENEPDYFLLDARLKQAFDRSLYSLREKKIVRLPVQMVDKIHVQTFSGNYELSRQDGKWYWTEPVERIGKKISEEQVYQLLLLLNELHIKEFLDAQLVEGRDLGFLHSAPFLQVWAQDKTCVLHLGKEIVEQDAYYGLMEGEKTPLEISKDVMTRLFKIFDSTSEEPKPVGLLPASEKVQTPAEEIPPPASDSPEPASPSPAPSAISLTRS